jgi:1,2-phenylacetyl-CoA epoxidase catalytic subunit
MSTTDRYPTPPTSTTWDVPQSFPTTFRWEYEDGDDKLLGLYAKGKRLQWDASERIDWSQDIDPENPEGLPDQLIPIYGSDVWEKLTGAERIRLRHHFQAWQLSQFLHGEQGALVCTAKIVQQVPSMDAKFYAATQVIDEARHVEAYSRLLHEKFALVYPINVHLQQLLADTLNDSRWDLTYLGMQVLIEGVALAAFGLIRDQAENPLARAVTAYVMQDEARHVAFGRLALRRYYPQLTEKERDEREEFVVDACWHMRDRFNQLEVWQRLGLPVEQCLEIVNNSDSMKMFRGRIFSRIVPTVRDIGLWGPRVQKAFAEMGAMEFANVDAGALLENDNKVADQFDAEMRVKSAAE